MIHKKSIHARHIVKNNGRKILLNRGLDVFQTFDAKDSCSLAYRLQSYRACRDFEVTFMTEE
ncbi:MAG: MIT C-terminal domain-containing protein [Pseudomonadota bacterium]